jgi:hypothetical protein
MKKTTRRRLDILEREDLARKQRELDSLQRALVSIWRVIRAHYLGGLQLDEAGPGEANARALKYPSADDYFQALNLVRKDASEIPNRINDAYRRIFAIAGLDFDLAPPADLFDAFVKFVNQLSDKWLGYLRSDLQTYCSDAKIAAGSNLPRQLTCDNFLPFEDSTRLRKSRVFTQTDVGATP